MAWLTGDFTGSGHTEIAQLWDNDGNLALNIYADGRRHRAGGVTTPATWVKDRVPWPG